MASRRKPAGVTAPSNVSMRFYLAEDIRNEVDGKVTMVGLYPDFVVVVNPDGPEGKDEPKGLRSLGFLFNFSGLPAGVDVEISIRIRNQKGEEKPLIKGHGVTPASGRSLNIVGTASPFVFADYGTFTILASVGDADFEEQFTLREASSADMVSSRALPLAVNRPDAERGRAVAKKSVAKKAAAAKSAPRRTKK